MFYTKKVEARSPPACFYSFGVARLWDENISQIQLQPNYIGYTGNYQQFMTARQYDLILSFVSAIIRVLVIINNIK